MRALYLMLGILYTLARTGIAAETDLKKADALFDKRQFQPALEIYDAAARAARGEAKWRAVYRAGECEALLFRYLEAANRLLDATLPTEPLWKARFLLLRAELGREYLNQYSWNLPTQAESGVADRARRTARQWHDEIRAQYRELTALETTLVERPLDRESYYVETEKSDVVAYPTLWDFAVFRAATYLLGEHPAPPLGDRPAPERFLDGSYPDGFSDRASPAEEVGRLVSRASNGTGPSKELWRLFRLVIPFHYADQVGRWKDLPASRAQGAARLKGWAAGFTSDRAKSDALATAAEYLEANESYPEAITLCKDVERLHGRTLGARRCTALRARIEVPTLSGKVLPSPPGAKDTLELTARNLSKLFVRVYATDADTLKRYRERDGEDLDYLLQLPPKSYEKFLAETPAASFEAVVAPAKPYAPHTIRASLPVLKPGLYAVILAGDKHFEPSRSVMSAAIANVTELFLFGSAGGPADVPLTERRKEFPAFHLYAVDGKTGEPAGDARFQTYLRQGWENATTGAAQADDKGRADITTRVSQDYQYQSLQALARRGPHHAYFNTPLSFSHQTPDRYSLQLESDRPIYRPGQKINVKLTALENLVPGWRVYRGKQTVKLTFLDPNGQTFHSATLKLNAYGSAAAAAMIPTGRLLGGYTARAELKEGVRSYNAYLQFQVEEYKRPEFEVKLADAKGPWKYGTPADVTGDVKYYFGGSVAKAQVTYRVKRQTFIPWFCWWWRWRQPGESNEVASGEVQTDENGQFKFTLTPEADPEATSDPLPAGYEVTVEARDAGGRTISASRRYQAGASGAILAVETPQGYLKAGAENTVSAGLRTLNDAYTAGSIRFQVFSLTPPSPFPAREAELRTWGQSPTAVGLDKLLEKVPDGPEAASGSLSAPATGLGRLQLPALKAGLYRLRLTARDPWGGDLKLAIVLAASGPTAPPPAPEITLAEHSSYVVGETAKVLLGSTEVKGKLFVEVWRGADLFRREILSGGTHVFSQPVTDALKGGFTVRWFGVTQFKPWTGEAAIAVAWKDKELKVTLAAHASVKPGEKLTWPITVAASDKRPVDGEATVRVYDRSLEYYATGTGQWASSLYPANPHPSQEGDSYFTQWAVNLPVETGWLEKQLGILKSLTDGVSLPPPPSLRPFHSRVRGGGYGHGRGLRRAKGGDGAMDLEGGMYEGYSDDTRASSVSAVGASARPQAAPGAPPAEKAKKAEARDNKTQAEAAPAVRSDFSETALFAPQIPIKGGKGSVTFTAPERLTSWKVSGAVLTEDAKAGTLGLEFATRKELMVRVELPRFFREGDRGTLKALVHNDTGKAMTAEVQIQIRKGEADASAAFGLKDAKKTVKAAQGGAGEASWSVGAPKDFSRFTIRIIARSGKFVDAEEREIPILPAKARLVESRVAYLDGNAKESFRAPAHVQPAELESATFQIDPQLAAILLNALPQLVTYPYECTEQLVNRFVPLSVVNAVFQKFPELREAAKKIPARKTVTPAWDRSDPRRLTDLAESPWALVSQGATSPWPTTDLTRPDVARATRSRTLTTLASYQLADGSFPWFPGGHSDLYLTLYVLEGLAELVRYGIAIPENLAKRAYEYSVAELNRRFKDDEQSVNLGLFGAYVLSAYFDKYPWSTVGKPLAAKWIDHAENHDRAFTALGLAYAAWVHHRLGDKEKAAGYLERALSGSRKDKVQGVYWQPEKLSWLWYHDTQEKHAFLLRTLQVLKPKDPRLPGLVQWLLFNRKGTEWKSTRSSAAAIYALVDYFQGRGALKGVDTYQFTWGKRKESLQVKGTDWLSQGLRWTGTTAAALSPIDLVKQGPGLAFASLTTIFSTENPDAHANTADNLLQLERRVFRVKGSAETGSLEKLKSGDRIGVGDLIEVQLVVGGRSQFEYVHLKAPRPAGFEPERLTSGWQWDQLSRYEEVRDSLENFFVSWLPQGEYVLKYRLRATTAGDYKFGPTVLQSMYAPEFSAYAGSFGVQIQ